MRSDSQLPRVKRWLKQQIRGATTPPSDSISPPPWATILAHSQLVLCNTLARSSFRASELYDRNTRELELGLQHRDPESFTLVGMTILNCDRVNFSDRMIPAVQQLLLTQHELFMKYFHDPSSSSPLEFSNEELQLVPFDDLQHHHALPFLYQGYALGSLESLRGSRSLLHLVRRG